MTTPIFKDHQAENKLFQHRVWFASIVIFMLFIALLTRLFYLQVLEHESYTTLSEKNRVTLLPIPPNRGLIYDRTGVLLAENIPSYSLHIVPEQVENLAETLAEINAIIPLSDKDKNDFYKQMKFRRRFEGIPIKVNLNEVDAARFAVTSYAIPGTKIVGELIRHYPESELFAHVIGYVGRIDEQELTKLDESAYSATQYIGKTGLENYYESTLLGKVGYQEAETDVRGRIVRILNQTSPIPGADLHLSIDINLQRAAKAALGDNRGSIIAIVPQTGEILAIVSQPSFDPNPFVLGIDNASYQALQQDPFRPLYNRALRGLYPPASTVKPIVALQGLHKGVIQPQETIFDPGYFQLPGNSHLYRDWRRHGHGVVDLHKAIVQSCDTYFYRTANKLGIDALGEIFTDFGYGKITHIDITGELAGLVPTRQWKQAVKHEPWYPGETVITGIGQGYTLVTPLQLAHAGATLANRGVRLQPHVVKTLQLADGQSQPITLTPLPPVSDADAKHWDFIQQALHDVVADPSGTAYPLSINAPFPISGKTGTAQVFNLNQGEYKAHAIHETLRDHSLFYGYAPSNNPQIAVGVIVENNLGAKMMAKAVIESYLTSLSQPATAKTKQPTTTRPVAVQATHAQPEPAPSEPEPSETEPSEPEPAETEPLEMEH